MGCGSSGQNWISGDVIERTEHYYLLASSCLKLSVTLLEYLTNISMLVASQRTHMTWFGPVSWPSWWGPPPFLSGCLFETLPVYWPVSLYSPNWEETGINGYVQDFPNSSWNLFLFFLWQLRLSLLCTRLGRSLVLNSQSRWSMPFIYSSEKHLLGICSMSVAAVCSINIFDVRWFWINFSIIP